MPSEQEKFIRLIQLEALMEGVDPAMAVAVARQESNLNPRAVGDNGKSLGLFQMQRAAASDAGIDPDRRGEPVQNIRGGVTYLKQKLQQSGGNVSQALSRYNRGTPDYRGIGDPHYVENVMRHMDRPARPQGMMSRVVRALKPGVAEAATVTPQAPAGGKREDPERAAKVRRLEALEAEYDRLQKLEDEQAAAAQAPQAPSPPAQSGDPDRAAKVRRLEALEAEYARLQKLEDDRAATDAPATQPAPGGTPQLEPPETRPMARPPMATPGAPAPAAQGPIGPAMTPSQVQAEQRPWWQRALSNLPVSDPDVGQYTSDLLQTEEAMAQRPPAEQAAYRQRERQFLQGAAATGISTAGSVIGTAAGVAVAPFTGPLAPAMPVVGEMAGSYGARKLNVALGLEEPGVVGDVASVALPGLTGLPGVVRGIKTWTGVPVKARAMVQAAKEADVPLTYGEATASPMAKRAETLLEQVPLVGTGGFRKRQQAAVKAAAERQVQVQQQVMKQTPWHGLPQVQAAAATGSKQAQRVLDDIAQSGDDWSRIVQASGNLKAYRARQVGNTLYDEVATLAEPLGNVPMKTTITTIDDTLKQLRTAVVPDTETIRYLEQLKTGLQGQTSTIVSPLLDASGNPITKTVTTPGKTTYGQLRQLRSDLGDTISDYYRGSNAVVGAKGVGSLAKVKTALEQDLDTFAMQSPVPELQAAAKRADTHWKRQVIPYEDQQLAKALTSDTPDEIYAKFIQRDHRDRATKFYNALDARGKAAVQYGMVAEAQQKALDPTTGVFSPAKFDGSLKAIQDARGVFFTGKEAWKIDGLMKVMRAAERAGQYAENPPTGQRVIPYLIGGGAVAAGPQAAAGAAAIAKGLSWLLASKQGTSLLLRAHSVAEQSLAMDQVLRQLETQGARVLAQQTGEAISQGQGAPGRGER